MSSVVTPFVHIFDAAGRFLTSSAPYFGGLASCGSIKDHDLTQSLQTA